MEIFNRDYQGYGEAKVIDYLMDVTLNNISNGNGNNKN